MTAEEEEFDMGMFLILILPILLAIFSFLWNSLRALKARLVYQQPLETSIEFFNDPIYEAQMDSEALVKLTPNQQEIYFQAKEYIKLNGYQKGDLPVWMANSIEEKGVAAWQFINEEDSDSTINGPTQPLATSISVDIQNKCEVKFKLLKFNDNDLQPTISIQTNNPIPLKGKTTNQDTFYIEYKIFNLPNQSNNESIILSLGLATNPYPNFTLPGRFPHSISYDSSGSRRFNEPFSNSNSSNPMIMPGATNDLNFPKIEQGDVIGIGLRIKTKAVFFTRNGKRISESKLGGHKYFPIDSLIYPTIGISYLSPTVINDEVKIYCNFGQAGYVFIEGNVKKWGLGNLNGNQPPPPKYERWNTDVILETTDDEGPPIFESSFNDDDLEIDFNEAVDNLNQSIDNQSSNSAITLDTLLPNYENLVEDDIKLAMSDRI